MAKTQSEEDKKKEADAKAQAELVAKEKAEQEAKDVAEKKAKEEADAKAQAEALAKKEQLEKGKKLDHKIFWGFRALMNKSPFTLATELKRIWDSILDMKADIEELKGKK
jgi:hypothetical protein